MSVEQLLASLQTLSPLLGREMALGRREARLPDPVARDLLDRGLFRVWIPVRFGGFELTLSEALQVYEAAARLDGSVGWAVMIGSGGGLFAAYLSPPVASRLFALRGAVVAGSGAPTGIAERVPGGYRATGHWRYASGAHYASVFTANCRIQENGVPVMHDGQPLIRAMCFSPDDVSIQHSWDTHGLRATGSHDIEVTRVLVPEDSTFSVMTDAPRHDGPLYQLPFGTLTELPVTAVVLGIAQHALDEFESLAQNKPAPGTGLPLIQYDAVNRALRDAHARVDAVRGTLYDLADAAWNAALVDATPDACVIAACTHTSVRLVRDRIDAIGLLLPLAGMNAIHREDPFAIAWHDLNAAAAHYSVSPLGDLRKD